MRYSRENYLAPSAGYMSNEGYVLVRRTSYVHNGAASVVFSSPLPCLAHRNKQYDGLKQDIIITKYSK